MTTAFTGYPPDALPLLTRLGTADRDEFASRRSEYDALVAEPTRALVAALAGPLGDEFGPGLQVVPRVNGSIAPIANDARFRRLPPYKDHVLLRFWEGSDKWACPSLFLRIDADEVRVGGGQRFADAAAVGAYRQAVAGSAGDRLAAITRQAQRTGGRVVGPELRRVPKGFEPLHPHADLLRRRQLGLQWSDSVPDAVGSRRFVGWCARRLARVGDLHRWLLAEVG